MTLPFEMTLLRVACFQDYWTDGVLCVYEVHQAYHRLYDYALHKRPQSCLFVRPGVSIVESAVVIFSGSTRSPEAVVAKVKPQGFPVSKSSSPRCAQHQDKTFLGISAVPALPRDHMLC